MSILKDRHSIRLAAFCALWVSVAGLAFAQVKGDANGDGIVNLVDAAMIKDHLLEKVPLTGATLTRADADGDGKVRMADLVYVNNHFYKPPVKNISAWIALPSGTPLSPTGMKIIAAGGEAAIDATWHFTGLPEWNTGSGQFVFLEDAAGSSVLTAYISKAEISTGTIIITTTHIATALVGIQPVCLGLDEIQRSEVIAIARTNPDFAILVNLVIQALQTDPRRLPDYSRFPQIHKLAADIANAAVASWQASQPAPQLEAPPFNRLSRIGNAAAPYFEDWPAGKGMTIVNPHLVFYGVQWGSDWRLVQGKKRYFFGASVRKDVPMSNGTYTVTAYMGNKLSPATAAEKSACAANAIKGLLLIVNFVSPAGIPDDNDLIEAIAGNQSEERDALMLMVNTLLFDPTNAGESMISIARKIVEELAKGPYNGSHMQELAHLFYRFADVDGRAWWRYFKNAQVWISIALYTYDFNNHILPFFHQYTLGWPDSYTYQFTIANGVLTPGWERAKPIVVVSPSTETPLPGQNVSFDATGTVDDTDPLSNLDFRWDYDGNGAWDMSWTKGAAKATRAYSSAGTYRCVVQARDSLGLVGEAVCFVRVLTSPGASISIYVTPDGGSWRLVGPVGFTTLTGTGDRTGGSAVTNCPAGAYTLSCNDNVAGYNPPLPISKMLVSGGTISFTPIYMPESGPNEITINLPGNVPLVLVRVPAGNFQMGSPDTERSRWTDEGPVHTVTIAYAFYTGKYEVTQKQWQVLMGTNPASGYGVGDNYPVYNVSWNDCQSFITALNTHITNTGQGPATFRLPSEAEWEYACRAGTQTRFFFGDSLSVDDYHTDGPAGTLPGNRSDYMWFGYNYNTPTYGSKPVGTKLPNQFGLYDMSGNIDEWCQDWWHGNYTGAPNNGSAWEIPVGNCRVMRGGAWNQNHFALYCRSAFRHDLFGQSSIGCGDVGFRIVRTQ